MNFLRRADSPVHQAQRAPIARQRAAAEWLAHQHGSVTVEWTPRLRFLVNSQEVFPPGCRLEVLQLLQAGSVGLPAGDPTPQGTRPKLRWAGDPTHAFLSCGWL